jgi:hypothetical protein
MIKGLTLEEFSSLSIINKSVVLLRHGTRLSQFSKEEELYTVYTLFNFKVEVCMDINNLEILRISAHKDDKPGEQFGTNFLCA